MRVDAMLADYAQVHANKLFVSGAGINLMTSSPTEPYLINFTVALEITVPWQATNQPHTIKVFVVDSDGHLVPVVQPQPDAKTEPGDEGKVVGKFNMGRSAFMEPGEDSLFTLALPLVGLPMPHPGGYTVKVEIDGTPLAEKRFRVVPQGGPPFPGIG